MSTETSTNSSCWKRRSPLEKKLTLLSIFAITALIALIILVVSVASQFNFNEENEISSANTCHNSDCIITASKIIKTMDTDVEPCDDFYQFACGGFLKNTVIPDNHIVVDAFSKVADRLGEQLRTIISEKTDESEAKPFRLAKDLYNLCMNKTLIEERGISPFLSILKKLGGWPVVVGKKWNDTHWSWQQAVKDFRKLGFGISNIFSFYIGTDLKNSKRRIINLDQPYVGLSREYLVKGLENEIVQAYYSYMVDVAVIFGANREAAEKELKESLEFQIALANILVPKEERRNITKLYNPMTLREVQTKYPYVDWIDYINALLPPRLNVHMSEKVIVREPKYFEALGKLLPNIPKRTIANFMMWRITEYSVYFLNEELNKRQHKYYSVFSGQEEQAPNWKKCIQYTSGGLYLSVGALYVRKHFSDNSKSEMNEMVDNIKEEFENILSTVEWMDDKTREVALKKVKAMSTHIGYPDELKDNNKLEEFYKNYDIETDKFFESALKLNIFNADYSYNKFRKPVNKTDWVSHSFPAIVNAFYSQYENSIQFPSGILQGQFFSDDRPKYMNYAGIGTIIGHEITHGFDDEGRQFNENGDLMDWWEPDTKTAYLEKAKCIIEQYGNYTDEKSGVNLNGINTQGENIADNGGVKEAYNAYKKWAQEHGPELKLPGLNYTPEQMFWISFAQTWCSVKRPESVKTSIDLCPHSPSKFRVLGPLKNMIDFSKDFDCPEDSEMNPTDKCEVW